MKLRKMLAVTLAAMVLTGGLSAVHAAEEETPGIVFNGDSQNYFSYNVDKNDFTNKFTGMVPGETRSEKFTLTNDDDRELRFYINASVLSDLNADGKNAAGAVYTITLLRNNEEFYQGLIGGADGSLKDLNSGTIRQSQLVAALKKGESCEIEMRIGIDGESMDNDYQDAVGQLRLEFNVEQGEAVPQKETVIQKETVNYIKKPAKKAESFLQKVNTGDTTAIMTLVVIVLVSGGCMVFFVKKRKNGEKA